MMTDTQLFEYLYFSPKTIKNKLVNHFEILAKNNILSEFYPKQYKLQKGVFKGCRVLCTAPNARLMNKIPYLPWNLLMGLLKD